MDINEVLFQVAYKELLLTADIPEEDDNYDSDFDPPFIPPAIPDPDLDYDEYSDGEIPEGMMIYVLPRPPRKRPKRT